MDNGWLGALITAAGLLFGGLMTAMLKRRPERVEEKNTNYDQIQEDVKELRVEIRAVKKQASDDLAQVKAEAAAQISAVRKEAADSNAQTRLELGYQRDITRILDNEVMDLRQGMSEDPPRYPPLPPRPPWPVMP